MPVQVAQDQLLPCDHESENKGPGHVCELPSMGALPGFLVTQSGPSLALAPVPPLLLAFTQAVPCLCLHPLPTDALH